MHDEDQRHAIHLRRAIVVARSAMAHGCSPFGAILVGADGDVIAEAENTVAATGDVTAHAERLLVTHAVALCTPDALAGATLYASAEPCAMCAGAIYWAGIGRLVFGVGVERLRDLTGDPPAHPTLDMPCRAVFATGQRKIVVIGPLLEDEAAAAHEEFARRQGA